LPSVWNLPVKKEYEQWNVIGVYNWSKEEMSASLTPLQLGLSARKSYVVYELWSEKFLGDLRKELVLNFSPTSSQILSVHQKQDHPFILSTSRHITQGAVDILDERWDAKSLTLAITSDNLVDGEYAVTVYVPPGHFITQVIAPLWA